MPSYGLYTTINLVVLKIRNIRQENHNGLGYIV